MNNKLLEKAVNGGFKVRLSFCIVADFARHLPVEILYELREQNLGNPPDLAVVRADVEEVVAYWRSQGIEPGSSAALQVDL